jgi:hypothetical protein
METLITLDPQKRIYAALALLLALAYKISIMSKFAEVPRCIEGYL